MPFSQQDPKQKSIEKMHKDKVRRWDNNSLSASIGGLMHDTIALVIAMGAKDVEQVKKDVVFWLHELREIAEAEKEPKPLTMEQIKKMNEEWQEKYNTTSRLDDEAANTNHE